MRRPLLALAGAALALGGCGGGPEVVALDEAGERVAGAQLPGSGRFALAYRHSYFRAPAEERFRALGEGGFALEAIASPHAGVLDYYELPGARVREGATWVLRPERPPRFARLPLAGTATGRRTLVAGAARVPLWDRDGGVRHLQIEVEQG